MNNVIKRRKVVLIGAGHVGSHAGYALASQGLVEEIVYIDSYRNCDDIVSCLQHECVRKFYFKNSI